MQGTPAQSLVQEDSTGLEATRPAGCLQWAYWSRQVKPECLERLLCNNRSHHSKKPARRNSRAVSARCKYSQATESKGHPAQPEKKKKRTRCYPIITPQNWRSGDSGPADACPGHGCCSLHPPPGPWTAFADPLPLSLQEPRHGHCCRHHLLQDGLSTVPASFSHQLLVQSHVRIPLARLFQPMAPTPQLQWRPGTVVSGCSGCAVS